MSRIIVRSEAFQTTLVCDEKVQCQASKDLHIFLLIFIIWFVSCHILCLNDKKSNLNITS